MIYTDRLTELNTDILCGDGEQNKQQHHTLSERVVSVTNAKDSNKWHHEKVCQKWDSNPRLQSRLRPEHSALDHSAILT